MLLGATNISSGRKRILLMIFPLPLNLNPICIYFHDFRDKIGDNYVNPLLKSKSEKSIKYSFGFVPSKWKTPIYFFYLADKSSAQLLYCSSAGDMKTILEIILLLISNIFGIYILPSYTCQITPENLEFSQHSLKFFSLQVS